MRGSLELLMCLEVMMRSLRVVSQVLMGVVGIGKSIDKISVQRFHSGYNICFHFVYRVIKLFLNGRELGFNLLINQFVDHINRSIK